MNNNKDKLCCADTTFKVKVGLSKTDKERMVEEITQIAVIEAVKELPEALAKDFVRTSEKGAINGVATLGEDGVIPSSQLPSYVDDVIEGKLINKFQFLGTDGVTYNGDNATGKIFIDKSTNFTYRWSGTQFTEIASGGLRIEVNNGKETTDKAKTLRINDVNYSVGLGFKPL